MILQIGQLFLSCYFSELSNLVFLMVDDKMCRKSHRLTGETSVISYYYNIIDTWGGPVSNHLTTQNTLATALTCLTSLNILETSYQHRICSCTVEVVMKSYTTQNVGTSPIKRVNGFS